MTLIPIGTVEGSTAAYVERTGRSKMLDATEQIRVGVEKLSPVAGDVILVKLSGAAGAYEHTRVADMIRPFTDRYPDVSFIVMHESVSLECLSPKQMELAGWVRKEEKHGEEQTG